MNQYIQVQIQYSINVSSIYVAPLYRPFRPNNIQPTWPTTFGEGNWWRKLLCRICLRLVCSHPVCATIRWILNAWIRRLDSPPSAIFSIRSLVRLGSFSACSSNHLTRIGLRSNHQIDAAEEKADHHWSSSIISKVFLAHLGVVVWEWTAIGWLHLCVLRCCISWLISTCDLLW